MEKSMLTFELNCRASQVNALRRQILAGIPVLACRSEDCKISVNTMRLITNEILADRISNLPINVISPELVGCKVVLHALNETSETVALTTQHLRLTDAAGGSKETIFNPTLVRFSDGTTKNVYNIIARMRPGEEVNLECPISRVARCGESGKYCVASTSTYWCVRDSVAAEKAYDSLPEEEKSLERKLNWNLLEANRFVFPNKYMFSVQSIIPDAYPNHVLVATACDLLISDLEAVVAISREKATETTIPNCTDYVLRNTDYTIGKLLEDELFASGKVDYVTFYKKHPHDEHGVLRVAPKEGSDVNILLKVAIEPLKQFYIKLTEGPGQRPLHPKLNETLGSFKRISLEEKKSRLAELGVPKNILSELDEEGLDGMAKSYLSRVQQSVTQKEAPVAPESISNEEPAKTKVEGKTAD